MIPRRASLRQGQRDNLNMWRDNAVHLAGTTFFQGMFGFFFMFYISGRNVRSGPLRRRKV